MEKKKLRPYSDYERQLVIKLVQKKVHILENRKTDGVSMKKKQDAWNELTSEFNNAANVSQTIEVRQLKKLWQNLKAKSRAKIMEAQRKRTDGSSEPSPSSPEEQNLSVLVTIMPTNDDPKDSDVECGERDNDSIYWQPKRRLLKKENNVENMATLELGNHIVEADVSQTSTIGHKSSGEDLSQQNTSTEDGSVYEDLKIKLLHQEFLFQKKKAELEIDHIKEKNKLEINFLNSKHILELKILKLRQELIKKELIKEQFIKQEFN